MNGNGLRKTPDWVAIGFTVWAAVVGLIGALVLTEIGHIRKQVDRGILPRAEERVRALERKVDKLENEVDDHGH